MRRRCRPKFPEPLRQGRFQGVLASAIMLASSIVPLERLQDRYTISDVLRSCRSLVVASTRVCGFEVQQSWTRYSFLTMLLCRAEGTVRSDLALGRRPLRNRGPAGFSRHPDHSLYAGRVRECPERYRETTYSMESPNQFLQ